MLQAADDVGVRPLAASPTTVSRSSAAQAAGSTAGDFDAYASCNRTCEMAMTRATGRPYRVLELLDEATA
ncbi:hypothetical protein [Streptomyces sp. NPDC001070]